jgi:3-phenylpropionate/trans-cinnamate dioxygenase ferredoxin reductase subunit
LSDAFELLVIGGGPAGLSAARGYRGAGGTGRVAIVTDEHRLPYQRPPLTKELLRGEADEEELPIEQVEWFTKAEVDLVSGRAVDLDTTKRVATLSGGRELRYGQCVLATGAEPARLPVPGSDDARVRVVRSLDHLRELNRQLDSDARVVVIGSGFIGCEIASSLRARGYPVALISDESAPNAGRLGDDAGAIIGGWLVEDGVELVLGTPLEWIRPLDGALALRAGEHRLEADVVVMATGVRPRSELASLAGIELTDQAIPVSAAMRTARDGVLAAGDVCLAENTAAGRPLRVEHWGDALGQGEIAGRTAAGESAAWNEVPGFWSTIGRRTLKYAAWGDGYERARLEPHDDGGFTVWYGRGERLVGVLAHEADDDYDEGRRRIAMGESWR